MDSWDHVPWGTQVLQTLRKHVDPSFRYTCEGHMFAQSACAAHAQWSLQFIGSFRHAIHMTEIVELHDRSFQ